MYIIEILFGSCMIKMLKVNMILFGNLNYGINGKIDNAISYRLIQRLSINANILELKVDLLLLL
mgnify:CR=1 FL=1